MQQITDDPRLASVQRDDDLHELAALAYLSSEGGSAAALYIIACEMRLMRKSLEEFSRCVGHVYDHGPAFSVTEVGNR
jgi:hypothetical protein